MPTQRSLRSRCTTLGFPPQTLFNKSGINWMQRKSEINQMLNKSGIKLSAHKKWNKLMFTKSEINCCSQKVDS